jgi:aquaporin Z
VTAPALAHMQERRALAMPRTLRQHWPEYLMEAAELGIFMISACAFTVLLEYPSSPVRQAIPEAWVRRALIGVVMGLTAVSIIYSPWGKRSGAHFNPVVTLTFFRLGKIAPWDAFFYVAAQFLGATAGVLLAANLLGMPITDPAVRYAVTVPGAQGVAVAFVAELVISFGLMWTVLSTTNIPRLAPFTGICAGALVALYIAVEAPLSGMSMNPARTIGSAVGANLWTALWVYFSAPLLGMLLAAEAYARRRGAREVFCAKLLHRTDARCIFCEYQGRSQLTGSISAVPLRPPEPLPAQAHLPP